MSLRRRSVILSYAGSGLLHAGLVTGLVLLTVPTRWREQVAPLSTVVRPSTIEDDADTSFPVEPEVAPIVSGQDALVDVTPTDGAIAEFTRRRLQQAQAEAKQQTVDEQTRDLEALGRQLTSISSEESLTELTETIAPWIGSGSPRATRPAETPGDAPFDTATAQVSDVLRSQTGETVQYVAVLVDAAGTTMQTPLEASDGETLYEVFQLMKQFPLLETIYRNSVMGLLDQLVEQQAASGQQQQPAEQQDDSQQ